MIKKKRYRKSLVWIRRDLRLEDHRALRVAGLESEQVGVVFVYDTRILNLLKSKKDRRLTFIFDSLQELDSELKKKGSTLIFRKGDPVVEIPKVAKDLGVDAVFFNEDYEGYAKKRDEKVRDLLWKKKIQSHPQKDHVIFSGVEVKKPDGSPYRVFTPYKNAWLKKLSPEDYGVESIRCNFLKKDQINKWSQKITLKTLGFEREESPLFFQKPGRKAAIKLLKEFSNHLSQYDQTRNYPSLKKSTSGLSVHLRFGTLSIRECVHFCKQHPSSGAQVWLSELVWRDFFQMILDQFPAVEKRAFHEKYADLKWPGKSSHFKAWCEGKTGFPIVDAAMRQLNQTGWMHNRLRMVVASFLVKDLLVDWRKGEAYFAEKLLDFDLAANNGGWQWSASTGCDAQPYFRIFHPVSQSKKFDSKGEFIRQWVPELSALSDKAIHFPFEAKPSDLPVGFRVGKNYPAPIVDHSIQRQKALELFKRA